MPASAADIQSLRRMTGEVGSDTYSDTDLALYIEACPLPYVDPATGIRYVQGQDGWVETYDLARAAARVWREKAAKIANAFDITTPQGARYGRSQQYDHCLAMAAQYDAQSVPLVVSMRTGEFSNATSR